MKIVRNIMVLAVLLVFMTNGVGTAASPSREQLLRAAFVRGGDLWLKADNQEKKLASGPLIRNPNWSYDGEWLTYNKGEEEQELWVVQLRTGQSKIVASDGGRSSEWAPHDLKLAYLTKEQLQFVDVRSPEKLLGKADGIDNYSWLPDGSGFFASSQAELHPDGWTPVHLYQLPLQTMDDPRTYTTVHVLPSPSDDFFAVGTSVFKWSADGKWIAFLAKPTASLSADSNILCVLSSDGVVFRTLDKMVNQEQWFVWAKNGSKLAYIAGEGREASSNKQLKVLEVTSERGAAYTPKGYVDQALSWQDMQHIVVSRAAEKQQDGEQSTTAYAFLVRVELSNGEQKQITKPSRKYGAYDPTVLHSKLVWVKANKTEAHVMLADTDGRHAFEWIKGIDKADSYYGEWDWSGIISFF